MMLKVLKLLCYIYIIMTAATTLFPLCVRDQCTGYKVRTVVAKVSATTNNIIKWASLQTEIGQSAHAVALVHLDADEDTSVAYIVLTMAKSNLLTDVTKSMLTKLESQTIGAKVDWIRPLDRRLTLLFGWGDVWADVEQVKEAIEREDTAELMKCFPMLSNIITIGNTELIPTAVEGLSTQTGLLCIANAPRDADQTEHRRRLYMQHELAAGGEGVHVFGEPGKKWECSVCNRLPAARCVCGAQRCVQHQTPPKPPNKVVWKQSEHDPAPFFVQDPTKMRKEQQVEWIKDTLEADASLTDFAKVYVKLFADKNVAERRRKGCLDLYRLFNPAFKITKECELCPLSLYEFQLVFDPTALPRCRWCSKQLECSTASSSSLLLYYCSSSCASAANPSSRCPKCQSDKPQELVQIPAFAARDGMNGMARCQACHHTEFCELYALDNSLHRVQKRGGAAVVVPSHWSKRRRS